MFKAVDLIQRLCAMLKEGQVELGKFVSSSPEVLKQLDPSIVSDKVKQIDFQDKVQERALGIVWDLQTDKFTFSVTQSSITQLTRRKVLSIVASIFDPLGLVSPFVLQGKRLLQDACILGLSWDDVLPPELNSRFQNWLSYVPSLVDFQISRSVKPCEFVENICELHHFCDGSTVGYGVCSYLRLVDQQGLTCVSLVFSKSRVAPVKPITIPRLELTSAVLAVKVSLMLEKELNYTNLQHYFYTDSKVVLGYISNSSKRFHVFVSNRVGFIQAHTTASQWSHIDGKSNPSDVASRGATPIQLQNSCWFTGPAFLQDQGVTTSKTASCYPLQDEDCEIKVHTLLTHIESKFYENHLCKISSFNRLIRTVGIIFLWLRMFRNKEKLVLSSADLFKAKIAVIRVVQNESFKSLFQSVRLNSLPRKDSLRKLNLFVDSEGILRVGGRLIRSGDSFDIKFPILIPGKSNLAELIIRHCHSLVFHQGRGMTLNCIRQSGFFIFGASSLVSRFIYNCVRCKRLRGSNLFQKMSDLPIDRLSKSSPFDFCGVDFFGPFFVKSRRSTVKYYGCLFTCLYSRAVHVETCCNFSSDSFLMALRRFIAIRGPIVHVRCDKGTNFVGASNELKDQMRQLDCDKIRQFLLDNNGDIEFKFNPPSASHFGGVFERQIGSIRRVFDGILAEFGGILNPESLTTFLYEASAIVNSRPLSCVNINDETLEPLTPNHLLTGKTRVVVSPPGSFTKDDTYLIKHWRRVQYLANLFWSRWKHEYLASLQKRSKWSNSTPNIKVGDIVLLTDDNAPRNQWKLARVVSANPSPDNLVRSVRIKLSKNSEPTTFLDRPIHKLILLVSS